MKWLSLVALTVFFSENILFAEIEKDLGDQIDAFVQKAEVENKKWAEVPKISEKIEKWEKDKEKATKELKLVQGFNKEAKKLTEDPAVKKQRGQQALENVKGVSDTGNISDFKPKESLKECDTTIEDVKSDLQVMSSDVIKKILKGQGSAIYKLTPLEQVNDELKNQKVLENIEKEIRAAAGLKEEEPPLVPAPRDPFELLKKRSADLKKETEGVHEQTKKLAADTMILIAKARLAPTSELDQKQNSLTIKIEDSFESTASKAQGTLGERLARIKEQCDKARKDALAKNLEFTKVASEKNFDDFIAKNKGVKFEKEKAALAECENFDVSSISPAKFLDQADVHNPSNPDPERIVQSSEALIKSWLAAVNKAAKNFKSISDACIRNAKRAKEYKDGIAREKGESSQVAGGGPVPVPLGPAQGPVQTASQPRGPTHGPRP